MTKIDKTNFTDAFLYLLPTCIFEERIEIKQPKDNKSYYFMECSLFFVTYTLIQNELSAKVLV